MQALRTNTHGVLVNNFSGYDEAEKVTKLPCYHENVTKLPKVTMTKLPSCDIGVLKVQVPFPTGSSTC